MIWLRISMPNPNPSDLSENFATSIPNSIGAFDIQRNRTGNRHESLLSLGLFCKLGGKPPTSAIAIPAPSIPFPLVPPIHFAELMDTTSIAPPAAAKAQSCSATSLCLVRVPSFATHQTPTSPESLIHFMQ